MDAQENGGAGYRVANPIFVMDYDVAAAFDHVSHHEIIKATMDTGVPPMLIAAWIREDRNSGTVVQLDDLFADNCWLIGMSVAELQTMAREWYELLKQAGFKHRLE